MKARVAALLVVVACLLLPPATAREAMPPSPVELGAEVAVRQAQIDAAVAPIRSRADLARHLQTRRDSPLQRMAPMDRARFIEGLVFTEKGLASYSFLPMEGRLSVTETFRILALFGAQGSIGSVSTLPPVNAAERAMLESSSLSAMAAMPPWRHGICVVNGSSRRCAARHGSNCSRACDR